MISSLNILPKKDIVLLQLDTYYDIFDYNYIAVLPTKKFIKFVPYSHQKEATLAMKMVRFLYFGADVFH